MKQFIPPLYLAIVLLLPCRCISQKLSLHIKQRPLAEVLLYIEQQTGYPFFISQELLAKARLVSVQLDAEELETALRHIFKQQPLNYVLVKGQLLIREKIDSLVLAGSVTPSIRPLIRSRIIDLNGSPLLRVSIRIANTNQITFSDSLGVFLLEKVSDSAHVFMSHIGYRTREIIAYHIPAQMTLEPDQQLLPEVPINSFNGYYQEPRTKASSSADVIPYSLFNRAVSSDVLDHIDHLTSGVLFNKGDALQTDALLIRGRSSILADARPLIILDHFPYDGDLRNLNPNDFLEISILKDAAATSLWGARAANGVIVIKTRRGTTPTTKIAFNSSFSLQGRPDLSSVNRISSADYIELEKLLFRENPDQYNRMASANLPLTPVIELLITQQYGLIKAQAANAQIEALKKLDVCRDIRRYLYQAAFTQRYALDLSGDIPILNYYLSAGMDQGQGTLVGERQQRTTLRSMLTFTLYPGLRLYAGIRYSQQNNRHGDNAGYGNYQLNGKQLYPYARLADDQGNALPVYLQYRQDYTDAAESNGLLNWQYKPLDEINKELHQLNVQDVLIQSGITYTFHPLLNLQLHYQFESQPSLLSDYYSASAYYTRDLANRYPIPPGGIADANHEKLTSHQGRAQFNLQKDWAKRHYLQAHAGIEIKHLETNGRSNRIYEGLAEATVPEGLNSLYPTNVSGTTDRFLSYYMQASYQFDSSFYLSGTVRKDAANLFGTVSNKKAAPFWSLGAAYHWQTFKFRASYGISGNIARIASAYTTARLAFSEQTHKNYLYLTSGPNDQLSWEQTAMGNVGIDAANKKGTFSGSLDYYRKRPGKLVVQTPMDPALGLTDIQSNSLYYSNVASVRGEGMELTLHGQFFGKGPVQWNSTFLLSHARSMVDQYPLTPGAKGKDYLTVSPREVHPVPGNPLFSIYSYPWQGLDGQTGQPLGLYKGAVSHDFKTIVLQTELNDMTFHGSAVPTWFGSLLNQVRYRQWELSCLVSYRLGYYFRKPALSYGTLQRSWSAHGEYAQRWQQPGDESHTQVPAMITTAEPYRDQFYQYASINVLKGDHIRLEDIILNYSITGRQLHVPAIRSIKISMVVSNIGMLWKANKSHIDPYYNDKPATSCSYSFGLNATL